MNDKSIAIIIYGKNEMYYNESQLYLSELFAPDDYQVDLYWVNDESNIIHGYNSAMQQIDAKYKIYIESDVFVINQNILKDIVSIFESDEQIGMIGVLGWKGNEKKLYRNDWSIGSLYLQKEKIEINKQQFDKQYIEVDCLDGALLATSVDIEWQGGIDGETYGYNILHSMRMKEKGLKNVIAFQEEPWCYSDRFYSALNEQEYCILQEMNNKYPNYINVVDNAAVIRISDLENIEKIKIQLKKLIESGAYDSIFDSKHLIEGWDKFDSDLSLISDLVDIFWIEKVSAKQHSVWTHSKKWDDIRNIIFWIRMVLLRFHFNRSDNRVEELKRMIAQEMITHDAIMYWSIGSTDYDKLLSRSVTQPLVSVVIAVYNGESFVGKTIQSVLSQTYTNLEIIIVDDASTDNSKQVINSYIDERIKHIYLDRNENVCNAANIGMANASGKYIAFIGHDDLWEEEKIQKQVDFMEKHDNFSVCFTKARTIDEDDQYVFYDSIDYNAIFDVVNMEKHSLCKKLLLKGNCLCAPSAVIRTEMLKKVGLYKYGLVQLQDYELWLRLIETGPFYIYPDYLIKYRRFLRESKNLSSVSASTLNRGEHESQWLKYEIIKNMSDEFFAKVMEIGQEDSFDHKFILCKKAFLLQEMHNCYCQGFFIEILEDSECRDTLLNKFDFSLQDFYRMNTQPLVFDGHLLR